MRRIAGKGFTLVETAIAIAVSSILMTGALAAYKTYLQKERHNRTTERRELERIEALEKTVAEMQIQIQDLQNR